MVMVPEAFWMNRLETSKADVSTAAGAGVGMGAGAAATIVERASKAETKNCMLAFRRVVEEWVEWDVIGMSS